MLRDPLPADSGCSHVFHGESDAHTSVTPLQQPDGKVWRCSDGSRCLRSFERFSGKRYCPLCWEPSLLWLFRLHPCVVLDGLYSPAPDRVGRSLSIFRCDDPLFRAHGSCLGSRVVAADGCAKCSGLAKEVCKQNSAGMAWLPQPWGAGAFGVSAAPWEQPLRKKPQGSSCSSDNHSFVRKPRPCPGPVPAAKAVLCCGHYRHTLPGRPFSST